MFIQDYSFQTKDLSQIVTGLNRTENLEFTATEVINLLLYMSDNSLVYYIVTVMFTISKS